MQLTRALLLALLLAAGMAKGDRDDPASEVIVTVSTARFDPAVVEVRRGVRVTFHSLSDLPGGLVVVAADGSFESWPLGMHGEWSHRFGDAGTLEYFVDQRPETRGRAIVE
jgi:plastocyanin